MRIWWQTYTAIGLQDTWNYHEQALKRCIGKAVRPDTQVEVHGVKKMVPKFEQYRYFAYLHVSQAIDNAINAEKEGYDAFICGGMRDPGFFEMREVVDIPVIGICETSLHIASMLAPKFALIGAFHEVSLRNIEEMAKVYQLEQYLVHGAHLGEASKEIVVDEFTSNPQRVVDRISETARKPVEQGAAMLIPANGLIGAFLFDHNVTELHGVPVLPNVCVTVKMAELMVELQNMGVRRSKKGKYAFPSKEEIRAARKLYGVE